MCNHVQNLQKAGSSMDRATAAVGGAFKKQLQPILTAVSLIF